MKEKYCLFPTDNQELNTMPWPCSAFGLFLAQTTSENCDQAYVQQMWFLIKTDFRQKKHLGLDK